MVMKKGGFGPLLFRGSGRVAVHESASAGLGRGGSGAYNIEGAPRGRPRAALMHKARPESVQPGFRLGVLGTPVQSWLRLSVLGIPTLNRH